MAKAAGIEILENRVRLLVIETGGKKPKIAGFIEQPIQRKSDDEWAPKCVEAIKEAFVNARTSKARVAAEIDSGQATLREMNLPFKEVDQLRAVVPNEMESLIHNYAIEDLVVDFIKTGEIDNASHILATAIPKKIVKERIDLLEQAGVDPVSIDLDVAALFNALHAGGAIETDEPFLILHGTPRFAKLIFVEEKKPKSVRTIRFSLPSLQEETKRRAEENAAREWQTTEVPGPVPIILLDTQEAAKFSELDLETRTSLIEILAKEISRFLLANAAAATPAHMLVTGDFEDDESAALLESATSIKTQTFSLLDAFEHAFHADELHMGGKIEVAAGLALKAAGTDALGMDFRKGEFGFKRKFESVKTTALVTIELLIVFLAALALHYYFRARDIADYDLAEIYDRQSEILEIVMDGKKPDDPNGAFKELNAEWGRLDAEYSTGGDFPLKQTALEVTGKLYKALQSFQQRFARAKEGGEEIWVQIDSVQVTQGTRTGRKFVEVTVMGRAQNDAYAERLRETIAKDPLFANANWVGPIKDKPVKFTLKSNFEINE